MEVVQLIKTVQRKHQPDCCIAVQLSGAAFMDMTNHTFGLLTVLLLNQYRCLIVPGYRFMHAQRHPARQRSCHTYG